MRSALLQICTNLNLFNGINVICSGLLIFRSLFIRDTGCNRRNSLLDFRITSSYFLRCCRNCICSFFSHASLFQLLLTRSGSFANSRNDRNLVVLNQCNAEEVRRFIDSTSNILLASFSRNCKIAGRVRGEVTARNNDFTLSRISRLANIFNRLKSLCTVMVIFSNNPLKVAASNRNSCRCSRPLVIILQLCGKYFTIENAIFDSHVAYIIRIIRDIRITINITVESTALNCSIAPVLNCLRRSYSGSIHGDCTAIYGKRTRIIFNLNRNTISTARNRQIVTRNCKISVYNNCSNRSLSVIAAICNLTVCLIANNRHFSPRCNVYQIVSSKFTAIGNNTAIQVECKVLI